MKKKLNQYLYLIITLIVAIYAFIKYLDTKSISTLIAAIVILAMGVGLFILFSFIYNIKTYAVIYGNTYYKFGEDIIRNAKFVKDVVVKDKKIIELTGSDSGKLYRFENDLGKIRFIAINCTNNRSLLIIKNLEKKRSDENLYMDLHIKDSRKNLSYVLENNEIPPLDEVESQENVIYSKSQSVAVSIEKDEDEFAVYYYRYELYNSFSSKNYIEFDVCYWFSDFDYDTKDTFKSFEDAQACAIELANDLKAENDYKHYCAF